MNNNESILVPLEFDSPVEFVLIGVAGKKRAVVAKSKGAKLDLVAYAQRGNLDNRANWSTPFSSIFPYPASLRLSPIAVDSRPMNFKSNHAFDARDSECTLVWRGAGYRIHKDLIEKELHTRIADIVEAVDKQSAAQLEWALSPIIDLCYRAIIHRRAMSLRLIYAFSFSVIVYVIIISFYMFSHYFLR